MPGRSARRPLPGGAAFSSQASAPATSAPRMTARNRFPMPGIMGAERAAEIALAGIASGRRARRVPALAGHDRPAGRAIAAAHGGGAPCDTAGKGGRPRTLKGLPFRWRSAQCPAWLPEKSGACRPEASRCRTRSCFSRSSPSSLVASARATSTAWVLDARSSHQPSS